MAEASHMKSEKVDMSNLYLDEMEKLEQLIMNTEEAVGTVSASEPQPVAETAPPKLDKLDIEGNTLDKLLAQGESFPKTNLGRTADYFQQRWIELVACMTTMVGYKPPGQEHLKQTAEVAVAQLAEAGRQLDAELARTAIRWTLRRPEMALKEEINALNQLNEEQRKILASKEGRINRRLQEFDRENSRRQEDHNESSTKL